VLGRGVRMGKPSISTKYLHIISIRAWLLT
jgi:hypothetical protein